MRHWMDFWYPNIVMQQGFYLGDKEYNVIYHQQFYHDYMKWRTVELEGEPALFKQFAWRELYNPTTRYCGPVPLPPIFAD